MTPEHHIVSITSHTVIYGPNFVPQIWEQTTAFNLLKFLALWGPAQMFKHDSAGAHDERTMKRCFVKAGVKELE